MDPTSKAGYFRLVFTQDPTNPAELHAYFHGRCERHDVPRSWLLEDINLGFAWIQFQWTSWENFWRSTLLHKSRIWPQWTTTSKLQEWLSTTVLSQTKRGASFTFHMVCINHPNNLSGLILLERILHSTQSLAFFLKVFEIYTKVEHTLSGKK